MPRSFSRRRSVALGVGLGLGCAAGFRGPQTTPLSTAVSICAAPGLIAQDTNTPAPPKDVRDVAVHHVGRSSPRRPRGGFRRDRPALRAAVVQGSADLETLLAAAERATVVGADGSRRGVFASSSASSENAWLFWRRRSDPSETGVKRRRLGALARRVFVPEQITSEYFEYSRWRCLQRLISATVNVFGVQAMILAVSAKDAASGKGLGTAAAIDWVLKDALGKVTRLAWAGKMGRSFDADAKRWRFRSSLLYATGNGLQIATFAFPSFFLLLATLANCLKQISLLTSTATRSAIYRSFAKTEATNNIGDVTAKGEAQIAVVDLLGMALGVLLTARCGFDKRSIVAIYGILSAAEIAAMYREIRSVVFRQLNLERALGVLASYVQQSSKRPPVDSNDSEIPSLPGPRDLARSERILLRPPKANAALFRPLSDLGLSPAQLARLIDIFKDEAYLVAPHENDWTVVLRPDATDVDLLRGLLARELVNARRRSENDDDAEIDVAARLLSAKDAARAHLEPLLAAVRRAGWSTTGYMFPDVRLRADWLDHRVIVPPAVADDDDDERQSPPPREEKDAELK